MVMVAAYHLHFAELEAVVHLGLALPLNGSAEVGWDDKCALVVVMRWQCQIALHCHDSLEANIINQYDGKSGDEK